jgi:peptide chain release factor 1
MKDSIRRRLEKTVERFEEVGALLADPGVIGKQAQFRELSMEYARLEPVAARFNEFRRLEGERAAAAEMAAGADAEMHGLAEEELRDIDSRIEHESAALTRVLIPKDPRDDANIFLEIRAGTGGDEAAIFAGDLFRMYARFTERLGWKIEVLSESAGEHGGYKEVISRVVGRGAYSQLKFESGTHRVQRVPATESQGRIHTSACTVAILPELEEIDDVPLNPAELRVDTFRASGAGGQHVNKTDSAIRITHLPTGVVVECQDERSQHKNRSRAMSLLRARLFEARQQKQMAQQAQDRKLQVGSGDRSERIRTYNYPQGRVTDHRINLTLYQLPAVMEGALADVIGPLQQEWQLEQLASLE